MAASNSERSLSRSKRRRREDIVDAALAVFDRDGFERARIDDVAKEAGVAKGTVYLYFGNKEALLEGVIRAVVKPAVDAVERAAESEEGTATERLTAQIGVMGERLGSGPMKTILQLMISEGPRHEQLRYFYFKEIVEPGMRAISKCLAQGEASGEFRPGAGFVSPQVFAGVPLMSAVWRILFDDLSPLNVDQLLQDHLRTMLSGLQSPRAPDV